jgi:uncharacterized membrane protein YjgN (DUF898 family)
MGSDDRNKGVGGERPIVERRAAHPFDTRADRPVGGGAMARRLAEIRGERAPPPAEAKDAGPRAETLSAGAPRDRLVEDLRFGEIFVLFIVNLALGIVTLGFYRFWGKTRIRKYVWSHVSFRGERFEYSGTGLEMFLGFIVAFLVFGVPLIALQWWLILDLPRDPPRGEAAMLAYLGKLFGFIFLLSILLYFLVHVATFASHRYRMSRTYWRGIRGAVSGSAWTYGLLGFGLSLLNGLTLYWTKPWADTVLMRYRLERTTIGSVPVTTTLSAEGLYGPFTGAWCLMVFGTIAVSLVGGLLGAAIGMSTRDPTGVIVVVVVIYVTLPLLFLFAFNLYLAAYIRRVAATTRLMDMKVEFPVRAWSLFGFNLANYLLLIVTLGLATPWVIMRYIRFIARNLTVEGELDYSKMTQSDAQAPRIGEGIAEFLGVGIV